MTETEKWLALSLLESIKLCITLIGELDPGERTKVHQYLFKARTIANDLEDVLKRVKTDGE